MSIKKYEDKLQTYVRMANAIIEKDNDVARSLYKEILSELQQNIDKTITETRTTYALLYGFKSEEFKTIIKVENFALKDWYQIKKLYL